MNEEIGVAAAEPLEPSEVSGSSEESAVASVEVVEIEPLNAAGLTRGQTNFFALGFFVVLMVIYFISQRGSISGRST